MKNKWLNREIFLSPFLTLCLSEKDFSKTIKRFELEEKFAFVTEGSEATTHSLCNNKKQLACIVCVSLSVLKGAESREQITSLLAHEAMHVLQYWRESITPNPQIRGAFAREIEAGAFQCIFQNLLYEYKRQTSCK